MLRQMTRDDLAAVSALGIASKASWGYSAEEMATFSGELILTEASLAPLLAAEVAISEGEIVGYFTIRLHADEVCELEHLFVAPGNFGMGIGTLLFRRALEVAHKLGHATLTIIADSNSAGFYERFGAIHTGNHQSSIPNRTIPIYEISGAPRASH